MLLFLTFGFCSQQTLANLSDINSMNAPSPNNTSFVQHENVTYDQLGIIDLCNGKRGMKLRQMMNDDDDDNER